MKHLLVLLLTLFVLAGCATNHPKSDPKPEPVHERAWIGGEYERVSGPTNLAAAPASANTNHTHKARPPHGLLITSLATNSPCYLAGLREGDLLLQLDQKPVARVTTLHDILDHTEPGAPLTLKVYRDGATSDYTVPAGRETFNYGGMFGMELPLYWGQLDLWPNPGFSLCVLGFQPSTNNREERGSVENTYRREVLGKKAEPYKTRWRAWLVIFCVERREWILSQQPAPAKSAPTP